jgi:hypothetical protein
MLFSALYGVGWQLALLILGVVGFAIAGPIHGDVYEEVRRIRAVGNVCVPEKVWFVFLPPAPKQT